MNPPDSQFSVPFDGSFAIAQAQCASEPPESVDGKYWKFSNSDLQTRSRWDEYMQAYESLLNETSSQHAPWYAIPADNKRFMRLSVARIVRDALQALPLRYPKKSDTEIALFEEHISHLQGEGG